MQFMTSAPNYRGSADPPDPAFRAPEELCYLPRLPVCVAL